jgi:hypothetical protein
MPNEQFATPSLPNALPRTSPETAYFRNVETLAATGSTQTDAAQIVSASGALVTVTAADATKGVRLPPITDVGQEYVVKNVDNAVLKVYGSTGGVINTLSANAAISMAARTVATFTAVNSTTWYTLPLLPS